MKKINVLILGLAICLLGNLTSQYSAFGQTAVVVALDKQDADEAKAISDKIELLQKQMEDLKARIQKKYIDDPFLVELKKKQNIVSVVDKKQNETAQSKELLRKLNSFPFLVNKFPYGYTFSEDYKYIVPIASNLNITIDRDGHCYGIGCMPITSGNESIFNNIERK